MHIANIFLFSTMAVFLAFIVNGAIAVCHNASWSHYERCFAPPPDTEWILTQRERYRRRAGSLFGVTIVLWLSTLSITMIESPAAAIAAACAIFSVSSIPFCRAMAALSREDVLNEADLRLYRAVDAISEHRLVSSYLNAVREGGRGWITKLEVRRLQALVREDEFRITRQHCLSARSDNGDDQGTGAQAH